MPVDAAEHEVLVCARLVRRPSEHRDPGPIDPENQCEQRRDHRCHDSPEDAEEADRDEPDQRELGIGRVDSPEHAKPFQIDEADHRRDDDGSEGRLREPVEERR